MRTGTCERCGDPFEDRSAAKRRRFCSDNCRKRQCEETTGRTTCLQCGGPMHAGSAWGSRNYALCTTCQHAKEKARTALIVTLWREGLRRDEIAERLGDTPESIGARVSELRREGVDLPYRRPDNLALPSIWQPGQSGRRAA